MEENIIDLVNKSILDMYSEFSKQLTETFRHSLDKNDVPFMSLELQYDNMGWTTAIFNKEPLLMWKSPVIEVSDDQKQFTYKFEIRKIKRDRA